MNRKQRLLATLQGRLVDRPGVSFYEINGLDEDMHSDDPFNIYSHPSWRPLIDLAREKSDRIVMRGVPFTDTPPDPMSELTQAETWYQDGSRYIRVQVRAGSRILTEQYRRDPDVNTTWHFEHLLKDADDLRAYLNLPQADFGGEPDPSSVLQAEEILGDSGIVMIDTADPLCVAAELFHMADFTLIATLEPVLFQQLLERITAVLLPRIEAISKALPGRLWRIVGPEYASEPYLHPNQFHQYATYYDTQIVRAIQRDGGFARLHCHGRLLHILDDIASTGCDALDPIEPPPQGDVSLRLVRERYGSQMVLFGNLEASDLENLTTPEFELKIRRALTEGTAGVGRGMVLMASSCPYGRVLTPTALHNYEKMIELAERF
jgi:hypothetical protein